MVKVKIVIHAEAKGDPYARYHGKAIDEDLPDKWWVVDPDKNIGTASYIFHHEQTVDLKPGIHTVVYGVSVGVGNWKATITVNGKQIASGTLIRGDNKLVGRFILGLFIPLIIPIPKVVLKVFKPKIKALAR